MGASRRVAECWSASDKNGGFATPEFRDGATSYTIGLDATQPPSDNSGSWGVRLGWPAAILGTDRNLRFDGRDGACSAGVGDVHFVRVGGRGGLNPPATATWTNAIHGLRGNVLSLGGSVHATTTKELDGLLDLSDDNGSIHFLVPK